MGKQPVNDWRVYFARLMPHLTAGPRREARSDTSLVHFMQRKHATRASSRDFAQAPSYGSLGFLARAITAPLRRAEPKRRLSLALQGGGSFGAFTWGVLDRLLEEQDIELDTVSGASAGAVNAVVLAGGLAAGGRAEAQRRLERFWMRVSDAAPAIRFGRAANDSAALAVDLLTRFVSPYQLNPLKLDPLRDCLADLVDFERLRADSPVQLVIAATRVKTGQPRFFRAADITLEAVLASACLPLLRHAVEIDGEWYWDGGYSANPPLRQLVLESGADDILLVQLTPETLEQLPLLSPDIARRMSQITFNGPLHREVEALADLRAMSRRDGLFRSRFCRKLQRLRLHRIAAEDEVDGLDRASALAIDRAFFLRLKESGRAAADRWLAGLPNAG
jgi:NTE family protein